MWGFKLILIGNKHINKYYGHWPSRGGWLSDLPMHPNIVNTVFLVATLGLQRDVGGGVADLHWWFREKRRLPQIVVAVVMLICVAVCIIQVLMFFAPFQATFSPGDPAKLPWDKQGNSKEGKSTGCDQKGQQTHRNIWKRRIGNTNKCYDVFAPELSQIQKLNTLNMKLFRNPPNFPPCYCRVI